jgi:hypothetical protein
MAQSRLETLIVHYGKYAIPSGLRPWLRTHYIRLRFSIDDTKERLSLKVSQWRHKSFLEWYASRLNQGAQNSSAPLNAEYVLEAGKLDLDILMKFGLRPHHRLHEFGVGYLRSGGRFIDYLHDAKFSANDISGVRIQQGLDHFGRERLLAKHPRLIVTNDNSFDWLQDKVDYFYSNAVLAHMPPEDIHELFKNLNKIMHSSTVALITYSELDVGKWRTAGVWEGKAAELKRFCASHHGKEGAKYSVKDFYYTFDFISKLCMKHGLRCENRSDLLPQAALVPFDRWDMLVKVTLA